MCAVQSNAHQERSRRDRERKKCSKGLDNCGHIEGLDHIVVNTHDIERAMHFYHEMLGLELLRLEEFRAGKVGFVSARISPETIIDFRPIAAGERVTPNMDHYCLVLGPTDMQQLHADLQAQGIQVEETVRPAWGAQGYGQQFK